MSRALTIVFLCGSLEPGQDGVGDYTRSLAAQLIRHGTRVFIIAINDRYVDGSQSQESSSQSEVQESDGLDLSVLRLASSLPWNQRIRLLQSLLDDLKPQWISLQYVPYAYSTKGIPLMLPIRLKSLKGNHRWHVMFHELWIGITFSSPFSHKATGFLQRQVVRFLLLSVDPEVVSTSNPLYQYLLEQIGVRAERFPLFSSIQVNDRQSAWMTSILEELGITSHTRKSFVIAGMFGSCYPDYPLELQVQNLSEHASELGKRLAVLAIGGGVGTGLEWEQRIRTAVPDAITKHLGRAETAQISAFLTCLDLGIPATPIEYLGKSSTAAAMVHHGVHVDTSYEQSLSDFQHLNLRNWLPSDLFNSVESVAQQYISLFSGHP